MTYMMKKTAVAGEVARKYPPVNSRIKYTINTTQPCHATGNPQPTPYRFAGNHILFICFPLLLSLFPSGVAVRQQQEFVYFYCLSFSRDKPASGARLIKPANVSQI